MVLHLTGNDSSEKIPTPLTDHQSRRKRNVSAHAGTAAGEQLLALRALANRPLRQLAEVSADPVGAWRHNDVRTIHGLAALELRSAGISVR